MNEQYVHVIFQNPFRAFAHHRIILNKKGKPIDYEFLDVNAAFEKLTGFKKQNILNHTIKEILPDIDKYEFNWIEKYSEVALHGGERIFTQYSEPLKKWYKVFVFSTEQFYFTTLFLDVSEEIRKEQVFFENQKKFKQLVEYSSDIIYELDENGIFIYVSPAWTKILGHQQEDVIGKSFQEFVHEADIEVCLKFLQQVISTDKTQSGVEYRVNDVHGKWHWHNSTATAVPSDNGQHKYFYGIARDITERKAYEEQLRKLSHVVEQSPNMILIVDLNFTIEYVNNAYSKVTGVKPEEIIGTKFNRLSIENEEYADELQDILETIHDKRVWRGELIDKKTNGEFYWQSMFISPIFNSSEKITHYVCIMQDISDRKKVEDELHDLNLNLEQKVNDRTSELAMTNDILVNEIIARKKNETELKHARLEAETANKAKSEFLSRMSHELRTPLNSILGFAQLFEMGELSTIQKKGIGHILKSGKHLLKLINEVLDIAKIESGKLSLSLEPVYLKEMIGESIDLVMPLTKDKQIQILYESNDSESLFIKADKQRFIQVMVNLLNNAIKYNKDSGWVKIQTVLLDNDTNKNKEKIVRILVEDSGKGISEKDLKKVFIPFSRVGDAEFSAEGTGLGLPIAKELMHVMGGTIDVKSIFGKGSTFWLDFPFIEEVNLVDHADLNRSSSGAHDANKKGTVLYIEDNLSNSVLIEELIHNHRPNIQLICDMYGKNAVQHAIENEPDLILLDLDLPDIHGSEVMKLLQENDLTKQIPVIVISADAMPEQQERLLAAGVKRYLTKPLDVVVFLNEIDRFISNE